MRSILYTFSLALFPLLLGAQVNTTLHETIPADDPKEIRLRLVGSYSVEPWAGNTILAETEVKLYDAAPHVLNFFVKEKNRYGLDTLQQDSILTIKSFDSIRVPIKYKETECYEEVHLRLLIPDSFQAQNDTLYIREE
jgi:hypothetical protein